MMATKFIWLFCRVVAFIFQFVGFLAAILSCLIFVWWLAEKI